jgi:hypothetical protein
MQDRRIWGHILIMGSPLIRSRDLDRWTRDISMKVDFLIDFQSMMRMVKAQWTE